MPCTLPSKWPVARNDKSRGTLTLKTSRSPSSVPTVKIENDAGCSVEYSASAAAIFMGCCAVMTLPWRSPVTATPIAETSVTTRAIFSDGRKTSTCLRRARCQALTPTMKRPAVTKAAVIVCGKATSIVELVSTAQKSVSSALPVAPLTW
jgi:hypothetical protein